MSSSASIIKEVPKDVSFQACKMHDGICLSAYERTTDAREEKAILLTLTDEEFSQFIADLQAIKR
jgi:hypothetical protein